MPHPRWPSYGALTGVRMIGQPEIPLEHGQWATLPEAVTHVSSALGCETEGAGEWIATAIRNGSLGPLGGADNAGVLSEPLRSHADWQKVTATTDWSSGAAVDVFSDELQLRRLLIS